MRVGYRFILIGIFVLLWHVSGRGVEAQTQRQHDAHVHGAGTLNLVQEGNRVHIELEIPGMDIVGFEHQATSASQKEAVKKAVAILKQGNSLFRMSAAAKCTLDKAEIDVAMMGEAHQGEDHHDKDHHDKDHHDKDHHDKDHDKDHHDKDHHAQETKDKKVTHHDHEREGETHKGDKPHRDGQHAEDEGERHSEFHATYIFTCTSPDDLKQLKTTLFDQFQNSESLQAQFVTARKQSAQRLSRQAPTLQLD